MRWLLIACGPMNMVGAVTFSPPASAVRHAFGLPDAAPFYLWVLSTWVLAFGVAYFHQGWTGRANRGVLAIGAWGKGVFAWRLIAMTVTGEVPRLTGIAAIPDLVLTIIFSAWLWRSTGSRSTR